MPFPKGRLYEDFYLMPRILCKAQRLVYIGNAKLYHYYMRAGGTTGKARNGSLHPDEAWDTYRNVEFFKKYYGKGSPIFKKLQACILGSCVTAYLLTKAPDKKFIKIYRKCIARNSCSIWENDYLGKKLKRAIAYIFLSPGLALEILKDEDIRDEQRDIIKKKI